MSWILIFNQSMKYILVLLFLCILSACSPKQVEKLITVPKIVYPKHDPLPIPDIELKVYKFIDPKDPNAFIGLDKFNYSIMQENFYVMREQIIALEATVKIANRTFNQWNEEGEQNGIQKAN